jgi:tRNA nucleotidyltransferase/poly(A) polymerase
LPKPLQENPLFELIARSAAQQGVEAYVIGGFVRDLLLKRPSKDIDVVCVGSGIDLARRVAAKQRPPVEVAVFQNFGTAMLRLGDWEVEFVGARRESYQRDSRKPIVEDGTLEDDQNRRDFTINALAISLQSQTSANSSTRSAASGTSTKRSSARRSTRKSLFPTTRCA